MGFGFGMGFGFEWDSDSTSEWDSDSTSEWDSDSDSASFSFKVRRKKTDFGVQVETEKTPVFVEEPNSLF